MLIVDFVKNKLWQVLKAIFSFYHIWYVISDEGKIAKYDKESVSNIAHVISQQYFLTIHS